MISNCSKTDFIILGTFYLSSSNALKLSSLMTMYKKPFENILGKGENAGNQHFLLFPPCFLPFPKTNFNFSFTFILLSANALNLDKSKIFSFGKELKDNNILDLSMMKAFAYNR